MAANTLTQLTTANTFQHWLTATQSLIGTANLLTNGAGSTFYANTRLEIGGANATLNVVTSATINDLIGTTANVVTVQVRNLNITPSGTREDGYTPFLGFTGNKIKLLIKLI